MERPRKLLAMASPSSDNNELSDRFSSLAEDIVNRIISFLGANETARLSLVSRRFRQLCRRSTHLYFRADFASQNGCSKFCNYVHNLMRSRFREGIKLDTFRIHWLCMERKFSVGENVVSWVNLATKCDVRELEILLQLHSTRWESYSLPESVCRCKSLRVLRLDLQQTGRLSNLPRNLDSLEELWLSSVTIGDRFFGENISVWWTSLKRLNLDKVRGISDLNVTSSSSLEELNMSNCRIGITSDCISFKIDCSSFKVLTIFKCHFPGSCDIDITCSSLQTLRVRGSVFMDVLTVSANAESVENLQLCGSDFLKKPCQLCIACGSSIQQITISSCKFEDCCLVSTNISSIETLTISELDTDSKCVSLMAENLVTLAINTSGPNSHQCALAISAPRLQAIKWIGHPVDFVYLESFPSLVNAAIDIKPSCRHKSKEFSCRCNLFKSKTCCFAVLLQCLRRAKLMKINTWPIELFFIQNEEPIFFDNLRYLVLVADGSLADKLPILASFLKGLPNLNTLIIECDKSSNGFIVCDPNLMNLLGFNPDRFVMSTCPDSRKVKISRIPTAACARLAEDHHP